MNKKFKKEHAPKTAKKPSTSERPLLQVTTPDGNRIHIKTFCACPENERLVDMAMRGTLAIKLYEAMMQEPDKEKRFQMLNDWEFRFENRLIAIAANAAGNEIAEEIKKYPQRSLGHKFWRAIWKDSEYDADDAETAAEVIERFVPVPEDWNEKEQLVCAVEICLGIYASDVMGIVDKYNGKRKPVEIPENETEEERVKREQTEKDETEDDVSVAYRYLALKSWYDKLTKTQDSDDTEQDTEQENE